MSKKKYISPELSIIQFNAELGFATSYAKDNIIGCTKNTAFPLRQVCPYLAKYEDLEPDVKINLKKNDGLHALNYRTIEMFGMNYDVTLTTQKLPDVFYLSYYILFLETSFFVFTSAYYSLSPLLDQIREFSPVGLRNEDVYLNVDDEVIKKNPTFCKLLNNAKLNDKNPKYGLPFLTFFDEQMKNPILCVCYKYDQMKDENDAKRIVQSLIDIGDKMQIETEKTGTLERVRRENVKFYRLFRFGLIVVNSL